MTTTLLALDLGTTTTGWTMRTHDRRITSDTRSLKPQRYPRGCFPLLLSIVNVASSGKVIAQVVNESLKQVAVIVGVHSLLLFFRSAFLGCCEKRQIGSSCRWVYLGFERHFPLPPFSSVAEVAANLLPRLNALLAHFCLDLLLEFLEKAGWIFRVELQHQLPPDWAGRPCHTSEWRLPPKFQEHCMATAPSLNDTLVWSTWVASQDRMLRSVGAWECAPINENKSDTLALLHWAIAQERAA